MAGLTACKDNAARATWMRCTMYDHRKVEEGILSFWKKEDICAKVKAKNAKGEPFYFCDGPPYATGQIHPGTCWNKTIKDAACRYQMLNGRNVRAQAGYDTHGLPIEVKVEQELKFRSKNEIEAYGIGRFIEKCKAFATKYVSVMGGQFQSLGVWMDFDRPYITYHDDFINSSWKTLRMAHEKGLMHEGVYVLPYCYRCETTIANYELEYDDETDPSVFVKFAVNGKPGEYLIIWTTTPWTLVANMAVMAHPTLSYARAKVGGETWIVAKERLDHLLSLTGGSATVLEELPGRKLKDIGYLHPLQDLIGKAYDRKVVMSDEFVTLEEGSGLVHCAPGHGPADFIIGKRHGIEPFSPVDGRGNYTAEAGSFAGRNVREANPSVMEALKDRGALVYESRIKHRYPHCWRCKTPLIFLTTNQWFITISKIRDQMLNGIDNTEWHPAFAKERFREFVAGAPDWCISRQRYWGIPLPIWKCGCGKIRVVGSRDELPELKELHRPYIDEIKLDCECGRKMGRIPDVLDVWFDSGNAVWASLSPAEAKAFGERADLIIEGQDQIRGWFYSLLGSGIVRYGACPYKRILMHGFFVDEKGEKMSKSVGNFVPLEQILEKHGADSFRLWGASNTVWEELRFSWDEMKKSRADLNIIFNLVAFLDNLHMRKIEKAELTPLDAWMISRLHSTVKEFRACFEAYELNRAARALRNFVVEDVSRFYMKIAKERIGGPSGGGALYTLYNVMLASLKMIGCFCPMLAEHLYQQSFRKFEAEESLFLLRLENADDGRIDVQAEKRMETVKEALSIAMLARQKAGIKVRWPVRTLYVETKSHEVAEAVGAFRDTLLALMNAKELRVVDAAPPGETASEPFTNGAIHIEKKMDEALYEEGMVNEVKRRVQMMRKEAKLVEADRISLAIDCEKELEGILRKHEARLASEVNAAGIDYAPHGTMTEYEIDGRPVKLSLKKAEKSH